jgi:hypothetical protein
MLPLFERDVIGTARHAWKAQLCEVVFPQADGALFMVSRLALENPVTATGTGIFIEIHHISTIGLSGLLRKSTRMENKKRAVARPSSTACD